MANLTNSMNNHFPKSKKHENGMFSELCKEKMKSDYDANAFIA